MFPSELDPLAESSSSSHVPGAKKSGTPFMHTTEAAATYKRVFFSALILSNERRLRLLLLLPSTGLVHTIQ